MEKHLELAQKAMAVLNQIEESYGDPHDGKLSFEKSKQIRAVGERLHKAGGISLMQSVCEAMRIAKETGQTDMLNREIDVSWNGIGAWQG